jgi:two-component system chemotaxis response regulator CheY
MRVLVLDDHTEFRAEVMGMLTRNGHEAEGVGMAEEAIPLVESGRFDFVLVDFNMPEHDGMWFMQHVKKPKQTKALLVTAHVNNQVIDRMIRSGASGYIIKPFDEDDLIRHLHFYSKGSRNHNGNGKAGSTEPPAHPPSA